MIFFFFTGKRVWLYVLNSNGEISIKSVKKVIYSYKLLEDGISERYALSAMLFSNCNMDALCFLIFFMQEWNPMQCGRVYPQQRQPLNGWR